MKCTPYPAGIFCEMLPGQLFEELRKIVNVLKGAR